VQILVRRKKNWSQLGSKADPFFNFAVAMEMMNLLKSADYMGGEKKSCTTKKKAE